jgi:ribosomal protein S18 acetylase RimI-like enzyme
MTADPATGEDAQSARQPDPDPVLEPATDADAEAIVALRDAAARWMQGRGIAQWAPGEVGIAEMRHLVREGRVVVVRLGGRVVAAAQLVSEDPDVWGDQADPSLYVHGLVIDRSHAGAGLGRAVLSQVERRAVADGARYLRLDCVAGNAALRAYYCEAGFAEVGHRSFGEWRHPTTLLQKELGRRPAG